MIINSDNGDLKRQTHIVDANKMLTAVEWLNENNIIICESFLYDKIRQSFVEQLINCFKINLEQAKQMEKEQMIEFAEQYNMYLLKCKKGIRGSVVEMSAEQYYSETYKTQAQ